MPERPYKVTEEKGPPGPNFEHYLIAGPNYSRRHGSREGAVAIADGLNRAHAAGATRSADLRDFIEKWRAVIAGDAPTAEPWAVQFEEEAAALLDDVTPPRV